MPISTVPFLIAALPSGDLDRIRAAGVDDLGNPLMPFVEAAGGSPLRCCLRESRPSERVVLIAYRPFPWSGPYAESGPVFIHAERCEGYSEPSRYPEGFARRRQLLRACDHDHRICDALVVNIGTQAERTLPWLLSRPEVDFVHSRNVEWGCYMFTVSRSDDSRPDRATALRLR